MFSFIDHTHSSINAQLRMVELSVGKDRRVYEAEYSGSIARGVCALQRTRRGSICRHKNRQILRCKRLVITINPLKIGIEY